MLLPQPLKVLFILDFPFLLKWNLLTLHSSEQSFSGGKKERQLWSLSLPSIARKGETVLICRVGSGTQSSFWPGSAPHGTANYNFLTRGNFSWDAIAGETHPIYLLLPYQPWMDNQVSPGIWGIHTQASSGDENNNQNTDPGENKDIQKASNIFLEIRTY